MGELWINGGGNQREGDTCGLKKTRFGGAID